MVGCNPQTASGGGEAASAASAGERGFPIKILVLHYKCLDIYCLYVKLETLVRLEDEIVQKSFKDEFHKLGVNLQFTAAFYRNEFRGRLEPYGISPEQFNILRILRGQHPNPASAKLVMERMIDKSSNVSRLVEKLRTKGMVTRTACDQDRRAVDLTITTKGLDVLAQLDGEIESKPMSLSEHLTQAEAKRLNTLLDRSRG